MGRHVKKSIFSGFSAREVSPGQEALIATPEKALVGLLYLTPKGDQTDYPTELRVTPTSQLDMDKLDETVEHCGSVKVRRAVAKLRELWKSESEYVSL